MKYLAVLGLCVLSSPVWADDSTIPLKCRPSAALDSPQCADILEKRFDVRNLKANRRDAVANEALKKEILASKTMTGETIGDALTYMASHSPFVAKTWSFVYSRSGVEYAVLSYEQKTDKPESPDQIADQNFLAYDDDHDADGAASIDRSQAVGELAWQVTGKSFQPRGYFARMIALGAKAFTWAANDGAKGFDNSGYNADLEQDFSWFKDLDAGGRKLSEIADPSAPNMTFFSYADNSYVVQSPSFSCPGQTAGLFVIQAPDCEKQAAAAKDAEGRVLPFKIIVAERNSAYQNNMVAADVAISVDGGQPMDWVATGVYVAEHSIVRDVTFATVGVFITNPWGDDPPQEATQLAKIYYAPDPSQSPWKDKWSYIGATAASSLADVEFDRLSNDLLDANVADPEVRQNRADAAAKRIVIKKYKLPKTWEPREEFLMNDEEPDRDHLHVVVPDDTAVATSMAALSQCLTSDDGNALIRGCPDSSPQN
jgi:hypothetical protein